MGGTAHPTPPTKAATPRPVRPDRSTTLPFFDRRVLTRLLLPRTSSTRSGTRAVLDGHLSPSRLLVCLGDTFLSVPPRHSLCVARASG